MLRIKLWVWQSYEPDIEANRSWLIVWTSERMVNAWCHWIFGQGESLSHDPRFPWAIAPLESREAHVELS